MNIKLLVALSFLVASLTACAEKELTKEEIGKLTFEEQKTYCSSKVVGKTMDQLNIEYGIVDTGSEEYFVIEDYENVLKMIQKVDTCYTFANVTTYKKTGSYTKSAFIDNIDSVSKKEVTEFKKIIEKATEYTNKKIKELKAQKSGDNSIVSK